MSCRAARLVRCGGGLAVGVEQQLCYIERRPAHDGVVQRPLLVLYMIVDAVSVGRMAACGIYRGVRVARAYVVVYAGCIAVGLEQQREYLQRCAVRGGVMQWQFFILRNTRGARIVPRAQPRQGAGAAGAATLIEGQDGDDDAGRGECGLSGAPYPSQWSLRGYTRATVLSPRTVRHWRQRNARASSLPVRVAMRAARV